MCGMTFSTPNKIYELFLTRTIDLYSCTDSLISIIENNEEDKIRIEALVTLKKVGDNSQKVYKYCENLMISDLNKDVRFAAFKYLMEVFSKKVLTPLKWALSYEKDYICIVEIINALKSIQTEEVRQRFVEEIKNLTKQKYFDYQKQFSNKIYRKSLKETVKSKDFYSSSIEDLAEILLNYYTIGSILKRFYNVFFEVKKGVVIGLDLSDLGWNVNRWKQNYSHKIKHLSEIVGLSYLTHLEKLDLSNNKINGLKGLILLKNIVYLNVSNNLIENFENINYIKELNNLKFLDISENKIVENINKVEFNKIEIIDQKHPSYN